MFVGQKVTTPYGLGKVLDIRDDGAKIVVEPSTWRLAGDQKPTFYMNSEDVKPFFKVGENIECSFGKGVVEAVRDADGIYVVVLTNWKLANGKSPTLYLNEQALSKPVKKTTSADSFEHLFKLACAEKDAAKAAYQAQNFEEAKLRYGRAVEILKRVNDEMSNEEKGRFFELTATCNSNICLCCFALKEYAECILYARNSIMLIETLEVKIATGQSELWKAMNDHGIMTHDKLKDLKAKAMRIIGKAEMSRRNYSEAKKALQAALPLLSSDKIQKEVSDLLADASKKIAAQDKKEKDVWQKAFKKGSKGEGDLYTAESEDKKSLSQKAKNESEKSLASSKKESKAKKEGESQALLKADSFYSSTLFGSFVLMGAVGLLSGAAYWWMRRRR